MIESVVPGIKSVKLEDLSVLHNQDYQLQVFDERTVEFLNSLSRQILKDSLLRQQPVFISLGYWLRKANIKRIISENRHLLNMPNTVIAPLGMVFHICPSNVDTMFFYSLALTLLTGNKNVMRISERIEHNLTNQLFSIINRTIQSDKEQLFSGYVQVIKYGHDEEINAYISAKCDARIIWGGDQTIENFRKYETRPGIINLEFADKMSFTIINTPEYNRKPDPDRNDLTRLFYNDIYTFDQMGCSSPQGILLLGDDKQVRSFLADFQTRLGEYVARNYDYDINSIAGLKFNRIVEDIISDKVTHVNRANNYLLLSELKDPRFEHSCGAGYLYYKKIVSISEVSDYIGKNVQTLTYFGLTHPEVEAITGYAFARGINRIVPIGRALEFDYVWDGYNIVEEMVDKKVVMWE